MLNSCAIATLTSIELYLVSRSGHFSEATPIFYALTVHRSAMVNALTFSLASKCPTDLGSVSAMFVTSNHDRPTKWASLASLCTFSSSIYGDSAQLAAASTNRISNFAVPIPVRLGIELLLVRLHAIWRVSLRRNLDCFHYSRSCQNCRPTPWKWPAVRAQPVPMCPICWWLSLALRLDLGRLFPISMEWSHHQERCLPRLPRFYPMERHRCLHRQLNNRRRKWVTDWFHQHNECQIITWNAIDVIIVIIVALLASGLKCRWFM